MKEPAWLNAVDIYGIHKEIITVSSRKSGIFGVGMIASSQNISSFEIFGEHYR